jgi:hypothetical protein
MLPFLDKKNFQSRRLKREKREILFGYDTMGERIERIGRIRTDFLVQMHEFQAKNHKNPFISAQSA